MGSDVWSLSSSEDRGESTSLNVTRLRFGVWREIMVVWPLAKSRRDLAAERTGIKEPYTSLLSGREQTVGEAESVLVISRLELMVVEEDTVNNEIVRALCRGRIRCSANGYIQWKSTEMVRVRYYGLSEVLGTSTSFVLYIWVFAMSLQISTHWRCA